MSGAEGNPIVVLSDDSSDPDVAMIAIRIGDVEVDINNRSDPDLNVRRRARVIRNRDRRTAQRRNNSQDSQVTEPDIEIIRAFEGRPVRLNPPRRVVPANNVPSVVSLDTSSDDDDDDEVMILDDTHENGVVISLPASPVHEQPEPSRQPSDSSGGIENEDGVAHTSSCRESAAQGVVGEEDQDEKKKNEQMMTQVQGLWISACLPKDHQETSGISMQSSSEASSQMMVTDVVESDNASSSSSLDSLVNTQSNTKLGETSIRTSQSSSWMKAPTTSVELGSATSTSVANLSASLSNARLSDNPDPSSSRSTPFKPKGATCFGEIELEILESDSDEEEIGDDVKDWCATFRKALEEIEQEEAAKQQRKVDKELEKLKEKENEQKERDLMLAKSLICESPLTRSRLSEQRKATILPAKKLTPPNTPAPAKKLTPNNTPAKKLAPSNTPAKKLTTASTSTPRFKLKSVKRLEKNQDTSGTDDDDDSTTSTSSSSVGDNAEQYPVCEAESIDPDISTGRVGANDWMVEAVTDYRIVYNSREEPSIYYRTKWQGWGSKYNSWEPGNNFKSPEVILSFWQEKQKTVDDLNAPFEVELTPEETTPDKRYYLDDTVYVKSKI